MNIPMCAIMRVEYYAKLVYCDVNINTFIITELTTKTFIRISYYLELLIG
jgi:hypothetical protein